MITALEERKSRIRRSARPDLSVVVPSVNGAEILLECVHALIAKTAPDVRLEILVVDRCGPEVRRAIEEAYAGVVIVPVAAGTTIPAMRAIGFRAATADAVAVIEDHILVRSGWARQLLDALAAGHEVVGGGVQNAATASTVDWAAFLCEYSHMLPGATRDPVAALPGNNVAYRRALLERYSGTLALERWENHLHAAMRRDGVRMVCRPDIAVGHKMHYRVRDYVSQRFLYARAFAGMRRSDLPAARRALLAVGSLALPPVLLFRVVRRVFAAGCHRAELLRSLPLLALFVCAWAAGETIGHAIGPGDALSRVK